MSEFVRICSKSDLPEPGKAKEIGAGSAAICLANVNGEISAMDNACPHRQGPLGQGTIENGKVVCPWHAYAFDTKTGAAAHNPNVQVKIYKVKIEGDDVLVAF